MEAEPTVSESMVPRKEMETVTIRFAGDSGDGMQLTGTQFTSTSVFVGNDVVTFPDFPAEIRAPAGTLPGVSGYQLSFSDHDIHTPGDILDVLVVMNPAALKVNLSDLEKGGIIIANSDSFTENDLRKAQYTENPLQTGELNAYRLIEIPISTLTQRAVEQTGLSKKQADKCKNMFALGIVFFLFDRSTEHTREWVRKKFSKSPDVAQANELALQAGYNYAANLQIFTQHYRVKPAHLPPGHYRQMTGNLAIAYGSIAAAVQAQTPLLLASYPITPASDVLHELSKYQHFGIKTFQAEDEIAAICAAIGASFGGSLAMTTTSGPGAALKSEAMGLAVMTELPLVIVNVQRAGPSTGMPTKTEQSDLLMALYGRHGECPMPVLAPCTPSDCFEIMLEAFRIALKYMTPVLVLSDGYLANGAEPWQLPDLDSLPDLKPVFHTEREHFTPYTRDPKTLARLWAVPGTEGLMHRLGGIEKDQHTGNVSYDPKNHEIMVNTRLDKVLGIAESLPPLKVNGEDHGDVLVVGWGGTYGSIRAAVESLQDEGHAVTFVHLRYLFPFQNALGPLLKRFKKVLVPELNKGQLSKLLRMEFLVDAITFDKVQGKPFRVYEIRNRILQLLEKETP